MKKKKYCVIVFLCVLNSVFIFSDELVAAAYNKWKLTQKVAYPGPYLVAAELSSRYIQSFLELSTRELPDIRFDLNTAGIAFFPLATHTTVSADLYLGALSSSLLFSSVQTVANNNPSLKSSGIAFPKEKSFKLNKSAKVFCGAGELSYYGLNVAFSITPAKKQYFGTVFPNMHYGLSLSGRKTFVSAKKIQLYFGTFWGASPTKPIDYTLPKRSYQFFYAMESVFAHPIVSIELFGLINHQPDKRLGYAMQKRMQFSFPHGMFQLYVAYTSKDSLGWQNKKIKKGLQITPLLCLSAFNTSLSSYYNFYYNTKKQKYFHSWALGLNFKQPNYSFESQVVYKNLIYKLETQTRFIASREWFPRSDIYLDNIFLSSDIELQKKALNSQIIKKYAFKTGLSAQLSEYLKISFSAKFNRALKIHKKTGHTKWLAWKYQNALECTVNFKKNYQHTVRLKLYYKNAPHRFEGSLAYELKGGLN